MWLNNKISKQQAISMLKSGKPVVVVVKNHESPEQPWIFNLYSQGEAKNVSEMDGRQAKFYAKD